MSRIFLLLALLWPAVAHAQAPPPSGSAGSAQVDRPEAVEMVAEARIVQVALEPLQPAFGEVFQVHVTLRLGPDMVALLPDTLIPTATAESAGAGEWRVAAATGDSLDVSATYPVIGFIEGLVELPWMELAFMRDETGGASASVKSLAEIQAGASARPVTRFLRLGGIDLGPFQPLETEGLGASPRPPADVLGGGWSVWRLLAVAVFALAGIGLVTVLVREARDRAGASALLGIPRGSPRDEALKDLERILALGWHRNGRLDEFYASTGDALRRFAGTIEPVWGLHLTSSELLDLLGKHRGLPDDQSLNKAIRAGERVKFGRERPEPERAEAHWTTVRDWIRTHPET